MDKRLLDYLICPQCQNPKLEVLAFLSSECGIETGMLLCNVCQQWYPIVDSIPIVSANPVIVDPHKKEIRAAWGHAFDFSKRSNVSHEQTSQGFSQGQKEQIEFYNRETMRYDTEITDTVFWRSLAKQTIHKWGATEEAKAGMILEVGCGTGASTVALAGLGCRIVALDICLTAAKVAQDKIRGLKLTHAVDFIVSEAEALPFRPGLFHGCIFSGVLHHVSSPIQVLKQISGVLENGGVLYGHENNASAFRFVFDLLMKIKQLWHEEAGTHPLMVSREVKKWGLQAGLDIHTESVVFLPPHFFNLFPPRVAQTLLAFTNRIFGLIPWFRDQGGLLILSGTKTSKG